MMETIRVLYVEDSLTDQELTRRHLDRDAPHVKLSIAETVDEALDQLAAGGVDLVLSDYRLPDGTGLDLLEAIKAREHHVPVVLVTGSGDADTALRLLKAGAVDYIVKRPDYVTTLPAVIDGAFRWFQSVRDLRRAAVRVLYAEDDAHEVELTRRALRDHGPHLHLEAVGRARDALRQLKVARYDLFLLDYQLPDLTGLEVLKALREEGIRVPVVMVTERGDEETAVQAFKFGVADYLIKREGYLAKLPSTVENVLAQRRLADENDALLVLNDLTRSIARVHDVSELVQRVTHAATDLVRADWGILWLVDGAELRPAGWVGLDESAVQGWRVQTDLGRIDRRMTLSEFLAGTPSPLPVLEQASATIAIPFGSGGQSVGVLLVASLLPREFTAAHERLLTVLGAHTAVAIENARLYQQLREQLAELQRTQAHLIQTEKLAAMGSLLAGVAHELNNPLSIVSGRAALLRLQLGEGALGQQTEQLDRAAKRCARIVKNFLAMARQRPPERQTFSLNQVAQEVVELIRYQLRVDDVELVLDLADDLPDLWGDPHQLHQVLVNLVANAHQALREAPQPRRVTLMTRSNTTRQRVDLSVADTGPGIPAEIQARIFEPFFTTKPAGVGTGLGLALCKGIIDEHGGSIKVASQPGQGAVFRIDLPATARTPVDTEAPPAKLAPALPGSTILVVDDEPEIGGVLVELLAADGFQVDTVQNGYTALDRIHERAYDLILSDLRMPGLDGPGLYETLAQRHPELLDRVIFIAGDSLSPGVRGFLDRTGAPCLAKPFVFEELRRVVQQTLQGARATQE